MKILQGLLALMFLAKDSAGHCEDVYIVNRKNLPDKRCMEIGPRDNNGPGYLMKLEDCDDGKPEQLFKIDVNPTSGDNYFKIESDKAGNGRHWYSAYLRINRDTDEMDVPSRLRIDNGCNNCEEDFILEGVDHMYVRIEVKDYDDDYCITGRGSRQAAGNPIIVYNCDGNRDNPRFEWYLTTDFRDNSDTIYHPASSCR